MSECNKLKESDKKLQGENTDLKKKYDQVWANFDSAEIAYKNKKAKISKTSQQLDY